MTTEYSKPLPRPISVELTRPFWEGAKRHELMMPRCKTCDRFFFYPREECPSCFSRDIGWAQVSGRGRLHTYTIVHQPANAAFREDAPHVYAVMQLDEGPRKTESSGPAEKTEPTTWLVDQAGGGQFTTIGEAIDAAIPGDRIMVRPGEYNEGLIIDKLLEIIGDGEVDEIVVEAENADTVLFRSNMGRVANLTLRQKDQWDCVDIAQGRLILEDCDITSPGNDGVSIHGGAEPLILRNRIHRCGEAGIHVFEDGKGTIEDNDISGNALDGVVVADGGNPNVRRNRIHDGEQGGVYIYENGKGNFESNDIFGNALAGVEVREDGDPTVRRNRIHDEK